MKLTIIVLYSVVEFDMAMIDSLRKFGQCQDAVGATTCGWRETLTNEQILVYIHSKKSILEFICGRWIDSFMADEIYLLQMIFFHGRNFIFPAYNMFFSAF
jgi:hypothetical protein